MHNQLEAYLKQIETQLKALPIEKQQEELREIEQHLQSMVAGSIELGATEEEAIASARRQFGNPNKVGRDLRKAYVSPGEGLLRIYAAGLCTLSYHVILAYVLLNYLGRIDKINRWIVDLLPEYGWLIESVVLVWVCAMTPFLSGIIGSVIAPRKAMLGIIVTYTEIALFVLAFGLGWRTGLALLVMIAFACLGALSWGEARRMLGDHDRFLRESREL